MCKERLKAQNSAYLLYLLHLVSYFFSLGNCGTTNESSIDGHFLTEGLTLTRSSIPLDYVRVERCSSPSSVGLLGGAMHSNECMNC